jgi:hypothetical protein
MSERPLLLGRGRIVTDREPGYLFEIEMSNGYRAMAVIPREAPQPPASGALGCEAEVTFSPYDMSRCRIARWLGDD